MALRNIAALLWLLLCPLAHGAEAPVLKTGFAIFQVNSPASNSTSSIGVNLAGVATFEQEMLPSNVMSSQNQYFTLNAGNSDTGEENLLCLDANGWINDLNHVQTSVGSGVCTATPAFTHWSVVLNQQQGISPYYQSGTWNINFSGTCNITVGNDGSALTPSGANSTGSATFTVSSPSNNGILFSVLASGSGTGASYCRNISVTHSSLTAAYLATCQQFTGGTIGAGCFNPAVINTWKQGRGFRYMDLMCTNNNSTSFTNYTSRPLPGIPFFGNNTSITPAIPCGMPVEFMVALCNATQDLVCWFNMPTLAGDNYVTNFATYVANNLNSGIAARIEYSNETWNTGFNNYDQLIQNIGGGTLSSIFVQYNATTSAGQGPNGCGASGPGANSYLCNRAVHGYMSMHFCDLWKTVFTSITGSGTRARCVMGAQAANTGQLVDALACTQRILWSGTFSATGTALTRQSTTAGALAIGVEVTGAGFDKTITGGTDPNFTFTGSVGATGTIAGSGQPTSPTACEGQIESAAIAPYTSNNTESVSFTGNAPDAGLTQLFSDWTTGCVYLPCSGAQNTGGTSTALTVTISGASKTNGNCYLVNFTTTPTGGTSTTINVNNGSTNLGASPLLVDGSQLDPADLAFNGVTYPICWVSVTASGAVGTPYWGIVANVGVSGGWLGSANSWIVNHANILASSYPGLNLVAYEGGQGWQDCCVTGSTDLTNLFIAAQYDSRITAVYVSNWTVWKNNGGRDFMHYNSVGEFSKFGSWALCESWVFTGSAMSQCTNNPKFNEWLNWNTTVMCWWVGCTQAFLRERDVAPASNDNRPAFTENRDAA